MRDNAYVAVVIPAINEERSIGRVIAAIPSWVDDIVVCDNGSTDRTVDVAEAHGARVVFESHRGYGAACQTALAALQQPNVVVFLDGDFSDHPSEMAALVDPILRDEADLVVGSRVRGRREPGALTPQARFGNWLACRLMRWIWGVRYTDLGPFRAIRFESLEQLGMCDRDYGWTVEMQIKAAAHGLRALEVPVSYRVRIGQSKVSGTVRGVVGAGFKIIYTILASALRPAKAVLPRCRMRRLIVFTRYPEPGACKTRLIPALGPDGAAALSCALTTHTLAWVDRLRATSDASVDIRFDGGTNEQMRGVFGAGRTYLPQGDGDLGGRLLRAVTDAFERGAARVVVVGTDCPALDEQIASDAFQLLDDHDLVLGPAADGGYYLMAMREAHAVLFQGIDWGSDAVLSQTVARAKSAGLSYVTLATLRDVDRPEDLSLFEALGEHITPLEQEHGASNEPARSRAGLNHVLAATAKETTQ